MPRSHAPAFGVLKFRALRAALIGASILITACTYQDATPLTPIEVPEDLAASVNEYPGMHKSSDANPGATSGLVPNTFQLVRLATDTSRCLAVSDDLTKIGNRVIIGKCGPNNPRMRFKYVSSGEIRTTANSCIGAYADVPRIGTPVAIVPCDGKPRSHWTYDAGNHLKNNAGACFTVAGTTLTNAARVNLGACASPAPWSQKVYWNTPGAPVVPPTTPPPTTPPPTTPPPSPTIKSIVVSPASNSIVKGDSVRLTPTAYNSSGQPVAASFTWSVPSGSSFASVSPTGWVKALNAGTATVRASSAGISGNATVTVTAPTNPPPPPTNPPPTTPPPAGSVPSIPPTLPTSSVNTSWRAPTGRTITVNAGDNLQNALNSAQRGDEVVIAAGATFTGSFVLPAKTGTSANGWITVRTSALNSLPPLGTRVNPAIHASAMPKLIANSVAEALRTQHGASGWRIVGIEVTVVSNLTWVHNGLVLLGDGSTNQRQLSQVASDLILDRVYIHGQPNVSLKRCVALNSSRTAIIESALLECHGRGFDSQAILGWNGPGPYLIENNKLEGAGEVIMFGGVDPAIQNLVPSDITIRRNYLYRPMSWKGQWTVKNLFELKNAQRVLVEGNVMENNWVDGQVGFAVVLGSADTGYSWCVVQDVMMRYNHIHNSAGAFNLFEHYGNAISMKRIAVHHNLVTNIGASGLGTNGRMFQVTDGVNDVWLEHNTGFAPTTYMTLGAYNKSKQRFTYRNNIGGGSLYNLHSPEGMGQAALTKHLTTPYVFAGNVIVGSSTLMPASNAYAPSQAAVGFVNPTGMGGIWSLLGLSPYLNVGMGGAVPGVNWTAFVSQTANVRS
ncbi:MAG: ricin-type beta-trefoil lectin domain protein [Gemmatimonadota bacterium]